MNSTNNHSKISLNLLLDKHVRVESVDGKSLIAIDVPRADRALKPIYMLIFIPPAQAE